MRITTAAATATETKMNVMIICMIAYREGAATMRPIAPAQRSAATDDPPT